MKIGKPTLGGRFRAGARAGTQAGGQPTAPAAPPAQNGSARPNGNVCSARAGSRPPPWRRLTAMSSSSTWSGGATS